MSVEMVTPSNENSTSTSSVPKSLRDETVVIVGGGPCGSLIAMLLDQRGVRTTLLERNPDFLDFNVTKAYPLGIFGRGWEAMLAIPGLLQHVKNFAIPSTVSTFHTVDINGKTTTTRTGMDVSGRGTLLFYRFRFLELLKTFLCENTNVDAQYGTAVECIDFKEDGSMDVRVKYHDGTSKAINTRFVIACDGINSVVTRSLQEAQERAVRNGEKVAIHSTRGFAYRILKSQSVGWMAKSLAVNKDILDKYEIDVDMEDQSIIRVAGTAGGGPRRERFAMNFWPMNTQDDFCGGLLAMISKPPDHRIWTIKTVDEAFEYFQRTFPQLDVRKYIPESNMKCFVESKAVSFPAITRPESLVATIGEREKWWSGGVVVAGDSAHCFPPNMGLGINTAFEDATVLMRVIDASDEGDSIADIVKRYEDSRNSDTSALIDIVHKCAPYSFSDDSLRAKAWVLLVVSRKNLAMRFPNLMGLPCSLLTRDPEMPFTEIWRRGRSSALRCWILVVSVVAIPLLGFALRSGMI